MSVSAAQAMAVVLILGSVGCASTFTVLVKRHASGSSALANTSVFFPATAAALWLLVPFAIVMPGAVAHQLYGAARQRPDQAYPMLIRELVPAGLRGFILAALAGAVISTLASVLNSASTLFTMDLYKRFFRKGAGQGELVSVGRVTTVAALVLAAVLATSPFLKGGGFFVLPRA